jgi:hypothetical protein
MFTTNVPVSDFLSQPFPSVSEGGFAGLVFLIARSADNPSVQRDFLRDWEDLHDVTARYLAVIVPAPVGSDAQLVLEAPPQYGPEGIVVDGLEASPRTVGRLSRAIWGDRGSRIAWSDNPRWEKSIGLTVAPSRPARKAEHRSALTHAASQIADFFGIPESRIPCAVIVSLQEKRVFAVTLDDTFSLYAFLKRLKQEFEPMAALLKQKVNEVAQGHQAVEAHHRKTDLGVIRTKKGNIAREWERQKAPVQQDLNGAAAITTGELSHLCRWMSDLISSNRPLAEEDRTRARRLVTLLFSENRSRANPWPYKTLARRVKHIITKLESDYPESHEFFIRERELARTESELKARLARSRAEMQELENNLHLSDAIIGAAHAVGLGEIDSEDFISGRQLQWPISLVGRSPRVGLTVQRERS